MSSPSTPRSPSAAATAALSLLPGEAAGRETAAPPTGIEVDAHRALIRSLQQGDAQALARVIDLYRPTVYGFLRARLSDRSSADDLCQEVFLRLYLGREKLDRAVAVGPWLIGIARNALREHVRSLGRRKETAWTELCLQLDAVTTAAPAPLDPAADHLPACLATLGQSARDAIELRYRSEWSHQQIAERLKRSEGAVKLLLHRARLALKSCLLDKLGIAP